MSKNNKSYMIMLTTTQHADTGQVVAIGLLHFHEKKIEILFSKNSDDEERVIKLFFKKHTKNVMYIYDVNDYYGPYLFTKAVKYRIASPKIKTKNLYHWIRDSLQLESFLFPDVTSYFYIPSKDLDEKKINELYTNYLSGQETAKKEILYSLRKNLIALRALYNRLKYYL